MVDIVTDIANQIDGDSVVGLTLGTNLFSGPVKPDSSLIPKNACFIGTQPGPEPIRVMGLQKEIRSPIIEVRLRWAPFQDGRTKILAIQSLLFGVTVSGYLDLRPINSEPIHEGPNAEGLDIWTLVYAMAYEATA